jgi:hypothetical protein
MASISSRFILRKAIIGIEPVRNIVKITWKSIFVSLAVELNLKNLWNANVAYEMLKMCIKIKITAKMFF